MNRYLLALVLSMGMVSICHAGGPFGGTTSGVYHDASPTGTYIDWYTPPWFFADNNGADAVINGQGTNVLSWGNAMPTQSSVTFTGEDYGPVDSDEEFFLGSMTYFNGTISFGSGAYGAGLTLSATDTLNGNVIDPLETSYLNIDTKNYNIPGAIPFPANLLFPAGWTWGDAVSADGMFFPTFGKYALVKEQAPPVTFHLFGKIVGDPQMILTDIVVDDADVAYGVIIGQPEYEEIGVPEPSTVVLSMIGLAGLLGWKRRR